MQVNGYSGALYQAYPGRAAAQAAFERWEAGEGSSSQSVRHIPISSEPLRWSGHHGDKHMHIKSIGEQTGLQEHKDNGNMPISQGVVEETFVDEWLLGCLVMLGAALLATSLGTNEKTPDEKL